MDGLNNQIQQAKVLAKLVSISEIQTFVQKQRHDLELELAALQSAQKEIERKEKERDQR